MQNNATFTYINSSALQPYNITRTKIRSNLRPCDIPNMRSRNSLYFGRRTTDFKTGNAGPALEPISCAMGTFFSQTGSHRTAFSRWISTSFRRSMVYPFPYLKTLIITGLQRCLAIFVKTTPKPRVNNGIVGLTPHPPSRHMYICFATGISPATF